MWKKIIVIVLFLAVIGAGVYGTLSFKGKYDESVSQNTLLQQQNAQVQAQLSAIGTMTNVYQVNSTKCSGDVITASDLVAVSVPMSTINDASITDINELVGQVYRVDINPGTIMSKDMLMKTPVNQTKGVYTRELIFESVPVGTMAGDYVDIRMILPNGEEYVILAHKQIKRLEETTITIEVSEEEHVILNAAIQDLGVYEGFCLAYMTRYLEPGNDINVVAYYPVQKDMENYVKFSPNITDPTRCVNTALREHIDYVFLVHTDSVNQEVASKFITALSNQYTAQLDMHNKWIEKHTDEEGNMVPETDYAVEGESQHPEDGDAMSNFNNQVSDAMDSLDDSLAGLEGLE